MVGLDRYLLPLPSLSPPPPSVVPPWYQILYKLTLHLIPWFQVQSWFLCQSAPFIKRGGLTPFIFCRWSVRLEIPFKGIESAPQLYYLGRDRSSPLLPPILQDPTSSNQNHLRPSGILEAHQRAHPFLPIYPQGYYVASWNRPYPHPLQTWPYIQRTSNWPWTPHTFSLPHQYRGRSCVPWPWRTRV